MYDDLDEKIAEIDQTLEEHERDGKTGRFKKREELVEELTLIKELDEASCRIKTLKRDNYTCQICGFRPARIVHHINSKNYYPAYRFNLENLLTLCEKCHDIWHKGNVD